MCRVIASSTFEKTPFPSVPITDSAALSPRDSFAVVTDVWVDGVVRLRAGVNSQAPETCVA